MQKQNIVADKSKKHNILWVKKLLKKSSKKVKKTLKNLEKLLDLKKCLCYYM